MNTIARKRIVDAKSEWELVTQLLPDGWREKAKELGAVRRARGIRDPETLLRMLLVHLADGCSLKETALRVEQAGWGRISGVALFKRLRTAGPWLAWMAQQMRGRRWPGEGRYRCLAADATTICESGKTGSLWRVHWCVNLASLQCEFFELTDAHGGEKFARFPIQKDDLILGDRGYCNPAGIDAVRTAGGHVLVRLNPMSLPIYSQREGTKIGVLDKVRGMRVGEVRSWPAWVKGPEGRWHRGRVVAVRRSRAATLRELRKRRANTHSRERPLGKEAKALARYLMVWTSVPSSELSDRMVLRYYRNRWQLELVFKRAKSIMGLGQLPKKSDASSRAWLNGKLLVAMMVEKLWQQAESFSPWGYALPRPPQPLA
jgi:hypothetical protein